MHDTQFQHKSKTILLVEDNEHIMKINRDTLIEAGYKVLEADTTTRARDILAKESPDLIVLDIMLPDGDGLELCRRIRGELRMENKKADDPSFISPLPSLNSQFSQVPIIFLSAKRENAEIIEGLKSGGDDYLAKPYDVDVLLARIEALLRRAGSVSEKLIFGPLILDILAATAHLDREDLLLTPKEFAVLFLLVKNAGHIVDKEEIFSSAWGQTTNDDNRALWTLISRLKKKLRPEQSGLAISLHRNKGYILDRIL